MASDLFLAVRWHFSPERNSYATSLEEVPLKESMTRETTLEFL